MTAKGIYNKVTRMGKYDLVVAGLQQKVLAQNKILAKDMPARIFRMTQKEGAGCCLNYALSMIYLLNEQGIEAYLATTPEENPKTGKRTHMHASVCYVRKGEMVFADPVKKVQGEEGDFSKISLQDFKRTMLKTGEEVKLFDCFGTDGEKLFFGEFTQTPIRRFQKEE